MRYRGHESGIYVIKNRLDEKVYIGQSRSIAERWKVHKNLLKGNKHYNKHLQGAFNKYGPNVFEYSVLEYCQDDMIDERESYWISCYKSNNDKHGYNHDSGGCKSKRLSESSRLKLSKIAKARGIPRETMEKAWEHSRNRPKEKHPMYGKNLTEEHKQKLRESHLGKTFKHSEETKRKIGKANSISKKGKSSGHKGCKVSEETRRKLSESHTGYIRSEESRRKQSESIKGRKLTVEHARKISEALKGKKYGESPKKIKVTTGMIDDVKDGMTGRAFQKKYGYSNTVWGRIKRDLAEGSFLISINDGGAIN